MYWSVRRELWENRSLWVAPLAAAVMVLFGTFVSSFGLPHKMRTLAAMAPLARHYAIAKPYSFVGGFLVAITFLVGFFYCLDALYGERRDRSILFWKSMPVSDRTTVLAKAVIPLLVLPVYVFAVIVATQIVMLLFSSVVLVVSGINPVTLWSELALARMTVILIYGLTVLAIWHAPIYGWLLLVSARVRSATFLWAILPLLLVGFLEKMTFNTTYFFNMLKYRLMGNIGIAFDVRPQRGVPLPIIDQLSQLTPGRYLMSPGVWVGLGVAAALLAVTVRVRRNREPI
jgi:ABC-2 type transport system permease protein